MWVFISMLHYILNKRPQLHFWVCISSFKRQVRYFPLRLSLVPPPPPFFFFFFLHLFPFFFFFFFFVFSLLLEFKLKHSSTDHMRTNTRVAGVWVGGWVEGGIYSGREGEGRVGGGGERGRGVEGRRQSVIWTWCAVTRGAARKGGS